MLSALMFNQASVQETSSTERVILRKSGGDTIGGGSLLSQERDVMSRNKAQQKYPNKRTIKAPPSKNRFKKNRSENYKAGITHSQNCTP